MICGTEYKNSLESRTHHGKQNKAKLDTVICEGNNSNRGLYIHVPARCMSQFSIFCPSCGSFFVNVALVIGPLYGGVQLLANYSYF